MLLLKRAVNDCSPINQLPSEMLSQIMREALPRERTMIDAEHNAVKRSIIFSHVCSRWRGVALSTPYLWNIVSFRQHTLFSEAFSRARGTLLSVTTYQGTQFLPAWAWPAILRVLEEMHRIGNLQLLLTCDEYLLHKNELLQRLCQSAPFLHSFTMLISGNNCRSEGLAYEVGTHLFAGEAPRLKHITLVGVGIDWSTTVFGSVLTVLEISKVPPGAKLSLSTLLALLSGAPLLQRVTLDNACYFEHITSTQAEEAPRLERVHLPALNTLRIKEALSTFNGIYTRLKLEAPLVDCTIGPWDLDEFDHLCELLSHNLPADSLHCRTLQFKQLHHSIGISLSYTPLSVGWIESYKEADTIFRLKISEYSSYAEQSDICARFTDCFAKDAVSIFASDVDILSTPQWLNALGKTNAKVLHSSLWDGKHLAILGLPLPVAFAEDGHTLIGAKEGFQGENHTSNIFMPLLSKLLIESLDLDLSTKKILVDALDERARRHHPLHRLLFENCWRKGPLAPLRCYAAYVQWRRREGEIDDGEGFLMNQKEFEEHLRTRNLKS